VGNQEFLLQFSDCPVLGLSTVLVLIDMSLFAVL
jgi:hypothetical protein